MPLVVVPHSCCCLRTSPMMSFLSTAPRHHLGAMPGGGLQERQSSRFEPAIRHLARSVRECSTELKMRAYSYKGAQGVHLDVGVQEQS